MQSEEETVRSSLYGNISNNDILEPKQDDEDQPPAFGFSESLIKLKQLVEDVHF
jgi:hypothetical protein